MEGLKIGIEKKREEIKAKVEEQLKDGKIRLKKLLINSLKKIPRKILKK